MIITTKQDTDAELYRMDAESCEVILIHPEAVERARHELPSVETMQEVASIFQVLADPTRARIVYALAREELCVCDVAAVAGLSVSAASHQLKRCLLYTSPSPRD